MFVCYHAIFQHCRWGVFLTSAATNHIKTRRFGHHFHTKTSFYIHLVLWWGGLLLRKFWRWGCRLWASGPPSDPPPPPPPSTLAFSVGKYDALGFICASHMAGCDYARVNKTDVIIPGVCWTWVRGRDNTFVKRSPMRPHTRKQPCSGGSEVEFPLLLIQWDMLSL